MADNLEATGLEFDTSQFEAAIRRAERRLDGLEDKIDRSGKAARAAESQFVSTGKAVFGMVAAYGGFRIMERTSRFIFDTNVEFEKLEATLGTVTGSASDGAAAFDLITRFAASTPFEIQNLTRSFIDLRIRGMDPTEEQLKGLGNFASAFVADITDLSDAVVSASAGMTRPLRRFGVDAHVEGDKIELSFQGVSRTMENTAANVAGFLSEMGNTRFADAMADRMETLDGALSNVADSASIAARNMGEESGLNAELIRVVHWTDQAIQSSDAFATTLGTGLAGGLRSAIELGKEWALILAEMGGQSPTVSGTQMSLLGASPEVLQRRLDEFVRMRQQLREIEANQPQADRLYGRGELGIQGFTAKDLDQLIEFASKRVGPQRHADSLIAGMITGGLPSGGAPGPQIDDKTQKKIDDLNASLGEQIKKLQEGEEAAYRFSLAVKGIVGPEQEELVEKWRQVQALEKEKDAREDAEKAAKQLADRTRQMREATEQEHIALTKGEVAAFRFSLAVQGITGSEQDAIVAQYAMNKAMEESQQKAEELSRQQIAELESEVDSLKRSAERMAESLTDAFIGAGDASENFLQRLSRVVDGILVEIERISARKYITDPFIDWLFGTVGSATGGYLSQGDLGIIQGAGDQGPAGFDLPNYSRVAGGAPATTTVVHQTNQFIMNAIDGRDAAAFLEANKGTIAKLFLETQRELG